tara:strand:- start:256 stop:432 length:177 start_codon:yes stop_codon:yes gene_type:complete
MFEGIVASVLSRYLGKYIQGLEAQNLSVGLLGGAISLKDLRIKVINQSGQSFFFRWRK